MSRPRNLIVAQSGGPGPVINSSLCGIIEPGRQMSEILTVYASELVTGLAAEPCRSAILP